MVAGLQELCSQKLDQIQQEQTGLMMAPFGKEQRKDGQCCEKTQSSHLIVREEQVFGEER